MKKIFFLLCYLFPLILVAQLDTVINLEDSIIAKRPTIFQYLHQDSMLHLNFVTKVKKLKKLEQEPKKHSAKLTLSNTSLEKTKWKMKLEQRGKLRRDICIYKPQRLKFSKKQLNKRGLVPRRNVKMVMRCQGKDAGNTQVLREYLVYRLYNLMTENSYQVQLVQASFQDTLKPKDNFKTYGFLIEPTKEVGLRNFASMSELQGKKISNLDEKAYLLMAVFQYMVGNTDWNIKLAHNVKFLRGPVDTLYTPVPYDFDFTGLVNAHYASPNVALPIDKVYKRLFMGTYIDEALLKETLELFQDKKEEMKELILTFPYLSEKERQQSWKYLDSFFKEISNPKKFKRLFPKKTYFQEMMKLERRKRVN